MNALDKIQIEVDKQMFLEQERVAAEEARIKEEGELRRKQMLQKLKEQAEAADKKMEAAQKAMGGKADKPSDKMPVLQAAGSSMAQPLNPLPVIGKGT